MALNNSTEMTWYVVLGVEVLRIERSLPLPSDGPGDCLTHPAGFVQWADIPDDLPTGHHREGRP